MWTRRTSFRRVVFYLVSAAVHAVFLSFLGAVPAGSPISLSNRVFVVRVLQTSPGRKGTKGAVRKKRLSKRDVKKGRRVKVASRRRAVARRAVAVKKERVPKGGCAVKAASGRKAGGDGTSRRRQERSEKASFGVFTPPSCGVVKPEYPYVARLRGWQGRVVVRALVDATGFVSRVRLVRSSGHRVLDDAALEAVRGWRCSPARLNGVAVPYWVEVPVVFRLF